jgi:lysophospholipase L1-like esterase
VERSTVSGGSYGTIATVAAPAITYTDTDSSLVAGNSYYYEVAAANTSGTSAFSPFVAATPFVPATFAGWAYNWFGLGALPSETSGTASPAHDGLSNTLKYAVGLDPLTPDTFQPSLSGNGATWHFSYQRPANRPDVVYAVQVSTDLSTWTTNGVSQSEIVTSDPETWQATCTTGTASKAFFRLKISGTATYALTVNNGTGSGTYAAGAAVTVTANAPSSGYQFAGWTGAAGSLADPSSATTTLTMPAAATAITATYTVSGSGGSVYLPNTATAPTGVYSQTKLISTYSGPAMNVVRSTDGVSMDIGFAGGSLDTATATSFAGGATLTVSKVYDQTGNGNHLAQPAVSLQPELFLTASSAPVILVRQSQYLNIPATLSANRQNFSSFMAARFPTNLRATPIADFNNGATFDFGWFSVYSNYMQECLTGTNTQTMGIPRTLTSASPCIAGVVSNASSVTFHRDNFTATAAPVTSEMMSNGGQLMATHVAAANYIDGRCDMFSWVFYPAALTTADATAVKVALQTLHNTNANTLTAHIFIQGDSITEGVGATNNITIARALTDAIGDPSKMVRCFGKSGDEMASEYGFWEYAGSYLEPGASNILVVWLGINDINLNQTAAQLWANYGTYIGYARAAGWSKIVGVTLLPDGSSTWTAALETQRQAFNAMVRANSNGYFNAIWDTDALTAAGQPLNGYTTNTALSPDHLHPSEEGYRLLAPSLKAVLNSLY